MAALATPFNVSEELAKLRHEKRNGQMQKLPANAAIQKRPIIHAPIASQYAGSKVPKVVYVSSKTPFISAVKRVKKLLAHAEKRATGDVNLVRSGDREGLKKLAAASDTVAKNKEEVLVKASGKAMTKALRLGEWFSNKEKDIACNVEIRSRNISVIDDIVGARVEESEDDDSAEEPAEDPSTELEGGDTTMELLGEAAKAADVTPEEEILNKGDKDEEVASNEMDKENKATESEQASHNKRRRRRGKRKRETYDADGLPESRVRWIKSVEVAISLKG